MSKFMRILLGLPTQERGPLSGRWKSPGGRITLLLEKDGRMAFTHRGNLELDKYETPIRMPHLGSWILTKSLFEGETFREGERFRFSGTLSREGGVIVQITSPDYPWWGERGLLFQRFGPA